MSKSELEHLAARISNWNWNIFFQAARNLGNQFNDRTWRFLKAEVLAIAMQSASGNSAEYVDDLGYDLIMDGTKIEVKTQEKAFCRNLDTASIRMKNTMGDVQRFEKTFDYLLIASSEPPYMAALTTWDEVFKGHKMTKDAVTSKIPRGSLSFLTPTYGWRLHPDFPNSENAKDFVREGLRKWVHDIEIGLMEEE